MSGSVYIFLLSSYFLCKSASVTPLPVVSTTTKAPDGNRTKLIEAIVAILSIGQPESKIADIRIDVDKKVRESNATDIYEGPIRSLLLIQPRSVSHVMIESKFSFSQKNIFNFSLNNGNTGMV